MVGQGLHANQDNSGRILKGRQFKEPIFHGSLAEYLIPKLQSYPQDKAAQVDGVTGETLTWKQLLKQSLQVSEGLKHYGLQNEDVVMILARNSKNCFIGALGTLWQGGTIAPLDPDMKPYELKFWFNTLKPKFVFSEEKCADKVQGVIDEVGSNPLIILIDNTNDISKYVKFNDILRDVDLNSYKPLGLKNPADHVAFIIISSGTTGLPKGVCLTDRNFISQLSSWYQLPATSILQISPFFWITSILMLLASCYNGMSRVYLTHFNELAVLKAIHKYKPTWMLLSPSEVSLLINHSEFHKYDLTSMKTIATGGSAIPPYLPNKVKEVWKSEIEVMEMYGMTEAAGMITSPSYGGRYKLTDGVEMKIVDIETKKILGPNQNGEFYIRSEGIMKSYYNNKTATEETLDEEKWLHTGDLGYYDEEGYIYIVDKIKELIKFRALQVMPAEIEALIEALPDVKEVGVSSIPHESDLNHPIALVVKAKGSKITEEDIIKHVEENLSDQKRLRGGVIFVDAVPRTPSGKIKRPALKEFAKKLHQERLNMG